MCGQAVVNNGTNGMKIGTNAHAVLQQQLDGGPLHLRHGRVQQGLRLRVRVRKHGQHASPGNDHPGRRRGRGGGGRASSNCAFRRRCKDSDLMGPTDLGTSGKFSKQFWEDCRAPCAFLLVFLAEVSKVTKLITSRTAASFLSHCN